MIDIEALQTTVGRPKDERLKEAILVLMFELRRANTNIIQEALAARGSRRPSWNTVFAKLEELVAEGSLREVEVGRGKKKRWHYYEIL